MGYYDGRGARRVHQLQVDGPIVWQAECSFEPASLLVDSLVDYATWAVSFSWAIHAYREDHVLPGSPQVAAAARRAPHRKQPPPSPLQAGSMQVAQQRQQLILRARQLITELICTRPAY